jgi:hypothetical protein
LIRELIRSLFIRRRSVRDDWIGAIPPEKRLTFDSTIQRWNTTYVIGSIALDEAFDLRNRGDLLHARQQAEISSELLLRLSADLVRSSEIIQDGARHVVDLPLVEPLKSSNFRSASAHRAASWNTLFHQVLFSARSRFFHKLRALGTTVTELAVEFDHTSARIVDGHAHDSAAWSTLEMLHDDLNTCLRESEIVLKSFLRAIPVELTSDVRERLEAPVETPSRVARPKLLKVSA